MEAWDARYGGTVEAAYYYGREPNDFLRAHEPRFPRSARVLCLAEGEGRNAMYLARCGHRVTSIDLSPVGVAKTLALAAQHGVRVDAAVGDLSTYAIEPCSWDAIVSIWAHVPHPLRRAVHKAVVAGLRCGRTAEEEGVWSSKRALCSLSEWKDLSHRPCVIKPLSVFEFVCLNSERPVTLGAFFSCQCRDSAYQVYR